jgi:hypothetical protein
LSAFLLVTDERGAAGLGLFEETRMLASPPMFTQVMMTV